LQFNVTSIKWISDTQVEVRGGFYAGGLNGAGWIYTVKKQHGRWKVTSEKLLFVS